VAIPVNVGLQLSGLLRHCVPRNDVFLISSDKIFRIKNELVGCKKLHLQKQNRKKEPPGSLKIGGKGNCLASLAINVPTVCRQQVFQTYAAAKTFALCSLALNPKTRLSLCGVPVFHSLTAKKQPSD